MVLFVPHFTKEVNMGYIDPDAAAIKFIIMADIEKYSEYAIKLLDEAYKYKYDDYEINAVNKIKANLKKGSDESRYYSVLDAIYYIENSDNKED